MKSESKRKKKDDFPLPNISEILVGGCHLWTGYNQRKKNKTSGVGLLLVGHAIRPKECRNNKNYKKKGLFRPFSMI